jgi:hypothetical protein
MYPTNNAYPPYDVVSDPNRIWIRPDRSFGDGNWHFFVLSRSRGREARLTVAWQTLFAPVDWETLELSTDTPWKAWGEDLCFFAGGLVAHYRWLKGQLSKRPNFELQRDSSIQTRHTPQLIGGHLYTFAATRECDHKPAKGDLPGSVLVVHDLNGKIVRRFELLVPRAIADQWIG